VILIVASDEDVHARRVAQEIEHIGAPAAIFDWRTAANTSVASLRYGTDRARRSVRLLDDHRAFDLDEVDAVWTRRVCPATVPPSILGVYRPGFYRWALAAATAAVVVTWYLALRRRFGPALLIGALVWPALSPRRHSPTRWSSLSSGGRATAYLPTRRPG
jgi:hypothetical protein